MNILLAGFLTLGPLSLGTLWLLSDLMADWTPWKITDWLPKRYDRAFWDCVAVGVGAVLVLCAIPLLQGPQ